MTQQIPANELKLGDVVKVLDEGFGTAVVVKVTDTDNYFFRPYAVTADFEYTGGVIPYVGTEEFASARNPNRLVTVYDRKEVR